MVANSAVSMVLALSGFYHCHSTVRNARVENDKFIKVIREREA